MVMLKPLTHSICVGTYSDSIDALLEMLSLSERCYVKFSFARGGRVRWYSYSRFESMVVESGFDSCEIRDEAKMMSLLYCSPLSIFWPTRFVGSEDSPALQSNLSSLLRMQSLGVSRYPHLLVWEASSEEGAESEFSKISKAAAGSCLSFVVRFGAGASTFANPLFAIDRNSESLSFLDRRLPPDMRGVQEFWLRHRDP